MWWHSPGPRSSWQCSERGQLPRNQLTCNTASLCPARFVLSCLGKIYLLFMETYLSYNRVGLLFLNESVCNTQGSLCQCQTQPTALRGSSGAPRNFLSL